MDDVNNKYNARKERNERIVKMREKLMQTQKVIDDANKKRNIILVLCFLILC